MAVYLAFVLECGLVRPKLKSLSFVLQSSQGPVMGLRVALQQGGFASNWNSVWGRAFL